MPAKKPSSAKEIREALAEEQRERNELERLKHHPDRLYQRKAKQVADFATQLARQEETKARTEALVFARTIAMAGLPKRPTKKKMLSRVLKLGTALWLEVSYHTEEDNQLPYGEDRFVLAAIQHLALEQNSPIVHFQRVGALLEMFGFDEGGNSFSRLRERFDRLASLSIRMVFARTEEQLKERTLRKRVFVIEEVSLPTREDIKAAEQGQMILPMLPLGEDGIEHVFGVQLGASFWTHLQEKEHHLIAPVELLKIFVDCPTGWDYLCFLIARCGRARSSTVVDHYILMGLFKEGTESDSNTIARLQKYHKLIMIATRRNLKASLEEVGYFPKKKGERGRRKKRWGLRVHPSKPIVFSGKKVLPFDTTAEEDSQKLVVRKP